MEYREKQLFSNILEWRVSTPTEVNEKSAYQFYQKGKEDDLKE